MRLRVPNLTLSLDARAEPASALTAQLCRRLGVPATALGEPQVVRESLDARGRGAPRFVVTVEVEVNPPPEVVPPGVKAVVTPGAPTQARVRAPAKPPIVVGAGPAGMFCALAMAEAGVSCVLLEQGGPVETRKFDVARLYREGDLDPYSNVSFGEGGAGTFSDGKLSTRVRDPEVREVLRILVEHGADPWIEVTNKPHLGSERLPAIVRQLREHLLASRCEVRFGCRVRSLWVENGAVRGVELADGQRLESDRVVLAPGNAARALFESLASLRGVLEVKPLAMGLRVEHPQALIDEIQYGRHAGHPALPTADYKLTASVTGQRGVYAFCMCPGGIVVPTPTVAGGLAVNGMSNSKRSSRWANSALVAQVGPADFAAAGFGDDVLAGVRYQEAVEARAFEAGGGGFVAPAMRLTEFVEGKSASLPGRSSFPRGLSPADLGPLYPDALTGALREAVRAFGRKMPGFLTREAVLIGAETRTSSPVTLPRTASLQSVALAGLYPCGEGCGHAGGIVSAAIDGLRVGRRIVEELG